MLRLAALLLLFILPPVGASSDESSQPRRNYEGVSVNEQAVFKNWGVGAMSCSSYIEAREFPDSPVGPYDATFRQWLMGFATAFNIKDITTRDLLGRTSVERAMQWIEGYCRKNGDQDFFSAVWNFTKMAYPHRVKSTVNVVRN